MAQRSLLAATPVLVVRPRIRLSVPVLLVLAPVVAACTPDPDGGEGSAAGGGPTDVAPTEMEPEFVADPECFGLGPAGGGQLECGMVEVPLDHDAPGEGSIEVAVVVDESTGTDGAEPPVLLQRRVERTVRDLRPPPAPTRPHGSSRRCSTSST